jgi:transposase
VVDAIRYLVRYGVEWRALPADFPPWQAVYAFFERWAARGLPQRVVDRLRGQLRTGAGRADLPTAAVIDSQSVKAADTVGAASSGYDGGKKIKGRKRHVAVDSNGWLLAVLVTAASVQDRDAGHRLLALLRERFSTITLVWADGGYAGRLVSWATAVLAVPSPSSSATTSWAGSSCFPDGGSWSGRSAGSTDTGAWSATTNGSPSTTRPCCCGPPP